MKLILIAVALASATNLTHAGTIYLCRGYDGSSFWTTAHCHQRKALLDRIATVRDGPFEQQVQEARQQHTTTTAAPHQQPFNRDQHCASLINERRQIEARYSNWQWQPPEVINPDQQRTRAINADLRANNCRLQ